MDGFTLIGFFFPFDPTRCLWMVKQSKPFQTGHLETLCNYKTTGLGFLWPASVVHSRFKSDLPRPASVMGGVTLEGLCSALWSADSTNKSRSGFLRCFFPPDSRCQCGALDGFGGATPLFIIVSVGAEAPPSFSWYYFLCLRSLCSPISIPVNTLPSWSMAA